MQVRGKKTGRKAILKSIVTTGWYVMDRMMERLKSERLDSRMGRAERVDSSLDIAGRVG